MVYLNSSVWFGLAKPYQEHQQKLIKSTEIKRMTRGVALHPKEGSDDTETRQIEEDDERERGRR